MLNNGQHHLTNKKLKLPIIVAPMFLISNPEMVIESCKGGLIGTFPALNARTNSELDNWMEQINKELNPTSNNESDRYIWGINFIPHKSNSRYDADLKLIAKHKPPLVITSLGDPTPVVNIVHGYGGTVFSDVINMHFAKKALEKGADGLILVANGAGGHGGELSPFAFLNEIRMIFNGPVVLAGAISEGKDILSAEIMGADFSYVGTRFIATDESSADENYKEMIIASDVEDIIYTDAFSGVHGNYLIPSIEKKGIDPKKLKSAKEINFDKTTNSKVKAWRDIWSAGQGVGTVTRKESIVNVINQLHSEYNCAKKQHIEGGRKNESFNY